MARGVGAGTLGILEHEGGIVAHLAHQGEGEPEILLRLVVIPHEHVGRDGAVGEDGTYRCHAVEIPFASVFPVHQLQNPVRTRLHGQMDVPAEVRIACYGVQRVVAHILRMRGGEAHAHLRHGLRDEGEEAGEVDGVVVADRGRGRTPAVAVHVLPEQRQLLVPTVAKVAAFGKYGSHVARAFPAAGVGHDAVVAEVVAAAHDADKARQTATVGAKRHHVAVGLRQRQLSVDSLLPHLALRDERGQVEIAVRAGDKVGMMIGDETLFHALRHTAQNAEDDTPAAVPIYII